VIDTTNLTFDAARSDERAGDRSTHTRPAGILCGAAGGPRARSSTELLLLNLKGIGSTPPTSALPGARATRPHWSAAVVDRLSQPVRPLAPCPERGSGPGPSRGADFPVYGMET
jgi:hypothetical protein